MLVLLDRGSEGPSPRERLPKDVESSIDASLVISWGVAAAEVPKLLLPKLPCPKVLGPDPENALKAFVDEELPNTEPDEFDPKVVGCPKDD